MPGFNHPIEGAHWPPGLETLEFTRVDEIGLREQGRTGPGDIGQAVHSFNCSIAGAATLPPELRRLWLSDHFDREVDTVVWPNQLREVGFGMCFNRSRLKGKPATVVLTMP